MLQFRLIIILLAVGLVARWKLAPAQADLALQHLLCSFPDSLRLLFDEFPCRCDHKLCSPLGMRAQANFASQNAGLQRRTES